ncbi:MAG: hypothetical protein AAGC45_11245 [Bacteroidota bacterium]
MLILGLFQSCDEDTLDCSLVDCAGFPSIAFEIVLENENVFEEEVFTIEDLSLSGNFPQPSKLSIFEAILGDGETPILLLSSMDWKETIYDFNLNIGGEYTSNLVVEIENSPGGGCCGGIPFIKSLELDEVAIENPNSILTLNFEE